ncbi:MAG: TSUP family transporter [Bacteroidia bacterium]
MMLFVVALVALTASMLTFFSGFGLGTILMPVFALFFPIQTAIALTAIVHLLNNLFKLALVYRSINHKILLRFGVPAILFSFIGAYLLGYLDNSSMVLFEYSVASKTFTIKWNAFVVGLILLVFSVLELSSRFDNWQVASKWQPVGGMITGFFGGLSGHQGALCSVFLLMAGFDYISFFATGVAIAWLVDFARISIYSFSINDFIENKVVLSVAVLSAFAGAYFGNKLFKKTSFAFLKWTVGVFMMIVSLLIISGVISK